MFRQPFEASRGTGVKFSFMRAFRSGREAKEFLISGIVTEAQHENIPLSEVERKMLYFTESGWTLPDIMNVHDEFGRDYDQDEYEQKIAKLVKNADRRIGKDSSDDYDRWWSAIRFLQREDHYISVMIRLAGLRPRGDQLRLLMTALGIVSCLLVWEFLSVKCNIPVPSRGSIGIFLWVVLACLFVAYMILRFVLGGKRADDLICEVTEKLVRVYQRMSGAS